ncbi:MAG: chorismate-binding protein [Pseudobdellovibrionaceae bacterium]
MERQNSITLSSITNFLETGALLRHEAQWILIEGPFTPVSDANSDEITIYCPDFYDLEVVGPLKGTKTYELSAEELRKKLESFLETQPQAVTVPLSKASWQEPVKDDFAVALDKTQERIQKNEIQKSVPVVFARSSQTVTPSEKAQMILNLMLAPSNLYIYGFWHNGEGILGATPEILFNYSQALLKTMAFAGTCPKSEASERNSLLQDEKEMQEHRFVVDDLEMFLKSWGTVTVQSPKVVELPTLYHLQTDIEVHCETKPEVISLIKELHPTPALGVFPRKQGYKWMAEFPGQSGRRRYGAPFAFITSEEALCLVAIRNLQWNKTESIIGSGCGVVLASELEREWRELFQKRLSVRKILGLE